MREFALTLSAAVIVSVVLSLTIDSHAVRPLSEAAAPTRSRIMKALEAGFHGTRKRATRAAWMWC